MTVQFLQRTHVSATGWYHAKQFFQHASGFSMDALHVMLGAALHLLIALLFRSSVGRPLPLLAVLVLELINEASDFSVDVGVGKQVGELAMTYPTMFVPTLLFWSYAAPHCCAKIAVGSPSGGERTRDSCGSGRGAVGVTENSRGDRLEIGRWPEARPSAEPNQ